ncbi:MAG: outer membrane beta-barrel protein [Betaproteobacteria bacterium]|nr:outer membrane beta-barrel protein [Betaproteobacteria bacterium]MDH5221722.1 outer membrane beta-barrel protein [Betaproteobacteria bacterium]MDH5351067.1 outer membrane beta-barrel protein [Betaproteobacteria bacterium]
MKSSRLLAAALGLGAAVAFSQASAQGFYMGASFGKTDADTGNAVPALISSGSVDGSDSGIKLFGGFAFNRNIAVEMAFVDLGELTYSGTYFGTPVTNGTLETSGFNFAAVGTIPLNPSFSLFGKLGLFFWEAEASDVTGGFPFVQTIDDVDVSYGFGASFQFNRNLGMQVEWEQYEAADSISLLSVGVVYRF